MPFPLRYVHRSRRFDDDPQTTHTEETLLNSAANAASNTHEYPTHNYRRPTMASTVSFSTNSNTFNMRRHSRSLVRKRKVTVVLIVCLFVALLLWTPQSLSLTYETLIEPHSQMSPERRTTLLIFNNFANLFLCINASIDFILYCFLSEKFARTCRQIICRQCSTYEIKVVQRSRMLSMDRTSAALTNLPNQIYHQKPTSNTTNKYYVQLYDIYQNSSGLKNSSRNKKWRKRFAQSITTSAKIDNQIFYRKSLAKTKSQPLQEMELRHPSRRALRIPVVEEPGELDENNQMDESMLTLETISPKPSCSALNL